jgi:tetratricopeptide (TPR) repeat protein
LLSRRAAVYEALGDDQAALADYTLELTKDTWAGTYGEVSVKRARLYMKLGKPEKARDDLTYALGKSFNHMCPKLYLLRAQAERQMGDIDAALEDEYKATHLPFVTTICPEK